MKTTKSLLLLLVLLTTLTVVVGADEAAEKEIGRWYPSLTAGLNLTQSAYSDNWAGGDKGSIVWTALIDATLERQLNGKVNWSNALKLSFGQTHNQRSVAGERNWDAPEKSTDLIDLTSLCRFTLGYAVDPYISARLESQFLDANDPAGRTINLNPLQLSEAIGIARKFIAEENRELLGRCGASIRQNRRTFFTEADPSSATDSETSMDGGLECVIDFKDLILGEKVIWTSGLRIFQPLFFSGKEDLEDLKAADLAAAGIDPEVADYSMMIDVAFENMFTTNVTEYLTVNLFVQWKYDKFDNSVVPVYSADETLTNGALLAGAVRKAGQFKQTLALGLVYSFF
ncbi:MAG: DUF3078 domain-containing protein [bacterium]|nr:DUF3078 domain-containing protein [bacterium]